MSRSDAVADDSPREAADRPGEPWMLRDDEFLDEADREYVVRDDGPSWLTSLPAAAFGALVGLLVADVALVGTALAAGREPLALLPPLAAAVGLRGLLAAKGAVAVALVALPGVTGVRPTRSARDAVDALAGLTALAVTVGVVVALA